MVKTEDCPQQPEPQPEAQPTTQRTTGRRKPTRRVRSSVSPNQGIQRLRARRSVEREEHLPETSTAEKPETQQERRPGEPGRGKGSRHHDFRGDKTGGGGTPQDTSTQPFHWTTRTYKNSKRNSRGQGKIDRNIFALNKIRGLSTESLGTTGCSRAAVGGQERGVEDTRMNGVTGWHARSPAGHFRFQTKSVRHDSLPRELESEGTQSHHSPDTFPLRRPKATLS